MTITEKQLEDFICKHPEYMMWEGVEIIDRQVHLPHGVLDILAFDGRTLVVELKARTIKEKDIGQVLRYTYDVRVEIERFGAFEDSMSYFTLENDRADRFFDLWGEYHGLTLSGHDRIAPVLIGPGITLNAKVAAIGSGIEIIIWKYDDEDSTISCYSPGVFAWRDNPYPDWCLEINKRIVAACLHDAAIDSQEGV